MLSLALVAFVFVSAPRAEAATTSSTSPYATSFPLCSGGSVYLTGLVHSIQRGSESGFEFNYRLTGTDESTGISYRFDASVVGAFAASPNQGTVVETFVRNVTLIGLAGALSYTARALVHVTIVGGTIAASFERFETSCRVG